VKKPFTSGFSLVELTLALGIAAFCLVTVFALIPVAALANRNATSQTAAASILRSVAADLRATPKTSNASTQFAITGINTGATPPPLYFDNSGQASTGLTANSRYQLNVIWSGSATLRYADLKVTWPAAATAANASGKAEVFAAFDRN
jgi:uncharacterized protein (TIGR02598 family)